MQLTYFVSQEHTTHIIMPNGVCCSSDKLHDRKNLAYKNF